MKKVISIISYLAFILFNCFAFDWPIENFNANLINSNFGQERGGIISTSIIFSEPEPTKASEKGTLLINMIEENDDTPLFSTALGNSVILAHNDQMLTVYGNLDKETLHKTIKHKINFAKGDPIADCGSSGWNKDKGSVEFQVIDIAKNTAINPKILMTRINTEINLVLANIVVENKNGDLLELKSVKSFSSGQYKIYAKKNKNTSPYKTSVTLNGVIVDTLQYDTIGLDTTKVYVSGKKKYYSKDIYSHDDLQLIGEAMFTPGKSTLGIYAEDFLGNVKTVSYQISIH